MEKIDWGRPIELMDGAHAKWRQRVTDKAITTERGLEGFVDDYGCIGGVQVVRNRKEPEKQEFAMWVNVRVVNGNHIYSYYNSRTEADMAISARGRIACLHIMKEFVEGEGI